MENFEDTGACLSLILKLLFPRCFLFAGFGKVKKKLRTPKNVRNERTDTEFFCSDHFARALISKVFCGHESSDVQEAHFVSGLHTTHPVSGPNLTSLTFFEVV